MKLFDTRKKTIIFIVAVVAAAVVIALAITLPLVLCNRDIVWTDKLDPGEVDTIDVTSPAIKLPNKPEIAPTTDKTSPTTFGTVSISNDCYTFMYGVEGESLYTVSYKSDDRLPSYAYVYVPVTNYNGKPYLKIKADCDSVERLAILAVYYEQYEDSRPAVAVYNNSVMDGENLIICNLDDGVILDSHYNVVLGENEKLTKKTICGFMLMIDSNPKQVIDEHSGKFTVISFDVVDDSDPDLNKLYAAPYISGWKEGAGFSSCKITPTRIESADGESADGFDAAIGYSVSGSSNYAYAEATIANYKSEYTTVKMEIKGENVKTLTIALKYSLQTTDGVGYNYISQYQMPVSSDWTSFEDDFAYRQELKSLATLEEVPGSYIKDLKPTAIYFFIDGGETNSGTLSVRNITFVKPETGGAPRITSSWALGAAGITKSKVAEGGVGTLDYNKWQNWFPVTVNVASYNSQYTVLEIEVKFYSTYSNLGVALGFGSDNAVILQSDGMKPDSGYGAKLISHTQVSGEDDDGKFTFHTIKIDFSNATATKGGSNLLKDQPITKILLFIDAGAPNRSGVFVVPNAGTAMEPARKMQFVRMQFKTPQEDNNQVSSD